MFWLRFFNGCEPISLKLSDTFPPRYSFIHLVIAMPPGGAYSCIRTAMFTATP